MRSAKEIYAAEPDMMKYIGRFVEACDEVNHLCLLGGGTGNELLNLLVRISALCPLPTDEPEMQMETFQSKDFGQLRIVAQNGEPWFIGKDVAAALGYKDTKSALHDHVDAEDKQILQRGQNAAFANAAGGRNATLAIPPSGFTLINESGLYSLILSSKLEGAKKFKRWVTSEVLPCIRKNGGYGQSVPKNYPDALRALADATDKRKPVQSDADAANLTFALTNPADGSEPFYTLVEG